MIPTSPTLCPILVALLAVNGFAFLAFWWDKRLAQAGARRISEKSLLMLAAVGGTAGAVAAQHLFRHKTRKEPFRTILHGIAFLQLTCVAAWLLAPEMVRDLVGLVSA